MKILVTGGAGYVGSHGVYALIEAGHEVVVVDNLVTGHRADVHKKAVFYHGNIADYAFMVEVFKKEKPDGVIHYAAYSLVGESMENPYKYYDNNVSGTNALLKAMVDCGVGHIVFSSTAAVYGDTDIMPITEEAKTAPTNAYGETKLVMERMIDWHSKANGISYVSLRYFNVAGAYPSGEIFEKHDPETHLIPIILQVAKGERSNIFIYGDDYDTEDGTCVRDYIHVMDLAQAHILAMSYLVKGGESIVCNLGNGEGFSVKEVIEAARKVTGQAVPAVVTERRVGDPARLIASSERAKKVLGWEPIYKDIEGVIDGAWRAVSGGRGKVLSSIEFWVIIYITLVI